MTRTLTLALAAAGLAACGGGGGGNSSTTGGTVASSTTVGTITGFGSIFVNGIEFETDGASFRVDDEDRFDDSALALGMKVRVVGTVDSDGRRGQAHSVYYDDDIEGPIDAGSLVLVDAVTKTFSIFGLTVRVDVSGTVFDDGASFDALAEGQHVEVSGFFDGSRLVATRVEWQGDSDVEHELKGVVQAYDGDSITLTLLNGASAGPFSISDGAQLEISAQPVGLFVEVKLVEQGGGLVAIEVESDDGDHFDDDGREGEVSIRGILKSDGSGGFLINDTPLALDGGTEYEPESLRGSLAAGMEVKAEGRLQGGVLKAVDIKTGHGEHEIGGRLDALTIEDAKTGILVIDLGDGDSIEVMTNSGTTFEDDSELDLDDDHSFDLDELNPGSDHVEIEAYENRFGQLIATRLEREDT